MNTLIDSALERHSARIGWDERLRRVYRRTRWQAW
jgi:hypothetical protein